MIFIKDLDTFLSMVSNTKFNREITIFLTKSDFESFQFSNYYFYEILHIIEIFYFINTKYTAKIKHANAARWFQ